MRDYYAKKANLTDFGTLLSPSAAQEPILSRAVRASVLQWLEELWMEEDLRSVGIEPRRRALFTGPPGGGKTTLAHHISARLRLPMLLVTADGIGDIWQNSATRNMGDLFEALMAEKTPLLVFFDEFDSLASDRSARSVGDKTDSVASVNVLLGKLDRYKGLIIAATNFEEAIDSAAWRRFDIQISLDLPGQEERERILARYFAPFVLARKDIAAVAEALDGATPALIRQLCEGVKRQAVIGPKLGWTMGKADVFERVITSVRPHPSIRPPLLWHDGAGHPAIRDLSWPLTRGGDVGVNEREAA